MATDVERLHYYERQYLGATDFDAQQTYHRDSLRRHLLGPHTWGIVTGLELTLDDPDVVIEEGLAVDAYGRTLTFLDRTRLAKDLFDLLPYQATPQWLTVSLRYAEETTGEPTPGFETCATGDAGYRIRETYRIDLATEQNPVVVAGSPVDPGDRRRRRVAALPGASRRRRRALDGSARAGPVAGLGGPDRARDVPRRPPRRAEVRRRGRRVGPRAGGPDRPARPRDRAAAAAARRARRRRGQPRGDGARHGGRRARRDRGRAGPARPDDERPRRRDRPGQPRRPSGREVRGGGRR